MKRHMLFSQIELALLPYVFFKACQFCRRNRLTQYIALPDNEEMAMHMGYDVRPYVGPSRKLNVGYNFAFSYLISNISNCLWQHKHCDKNS